MKSWKITFYARRKEEVVTRLFLAETKERAIVGIRYYGSREEDIIEIKEHAV